MPYQKATAKLRELLNRQGRVMTVMHPPSVALARAMEAAGIECGFVGTSGVVGSYTGMEDTGIASVPECVMIGGWIARAVEMPIMLDGDTGHGGVMSVRRLVEDCIRAGMAGIRIDDQAIEGKRATGTAGIEVAPIDVVLARYRAAVDMAKELDPNFVIMAQCYTAEAGNGGFEEALTRMRLYEEVGGVDWVQLTAPKSVDQVKQARATVKGPFSIMEHWLPSRPSHQDLLDWGITLQWNGGNPHDVSTAAVYDFCKDFMERGTQATRDWEEANKANPIVNRSLKLRGAQVKLQQELEKKYFTTEMLEKYEVSQGRPH
jgi:methylisocitrate lyase